MRTMFPVGATWSSGKGLAQPETMADSSMLWENLLSPEKRVDDGPHGSSVLGWFWDLATRAPLNKGVLTSKEWEHLTNIARMGFGVDMKGLPCLILTEAALLGSGKLTLESLARVRDSSVYKRALEHHLNSLDSSYSRESTEEYLEAFFAVVESRRDLEEDFLSQDVSIIDDRFKERTHYDFKALATAVPSMVISRISQDQWDNLLRLGHVRGIGGDTVADLSLEKLHETVMSKPIHEALAEHSPGYVTGKQLLEFSALVEEYNEEWALASFQWGPEPLR